MWAGIYLLMLINFTGGGVCNHNITLSILITYVHPYSTHNLNTLNLINGFKIIKKIKAVIFDIICQILLTLYVKYYLPSFSKLLFNTVTHVRLILILSPIVDMLLEGSQDIGTRVVHLPIIRSIAIFG